MTALLISIINSKRSGWQSSLLLYYLQSSVLQYNMYMLYVYTLIPLYN